MAGPGQHPPRYGDRWKIAVFAQQRSAQQVVHADPSIPVVVMLNPYQTYAEDSIARLFRDYGIATVALHTNWRTRVILEGRVPILRSRAVVAHYMVGSDGVAALADVLGRRHRVVGVVPHDEGAVVPLMKLATSLGLDWAQPELIAALGSKAELKALIARNDPGVRLNAFASVADVPDVRAWLRATGIDRFVLKPAAGSGNRDVAFFCAKDCDESDDVAVARYFSAMDESVTIEEFIDGAEYWVNGQVDAHGGVLVTAIGQYDRRPLNGRRNIEVGARTLASSHPHFAALAEYAARIVRATGVVRSPFHLEAMVDDRGPCLIEVGMRWCGDMLVYADSWMHGGDVDLIDAALHAYLSAEPYRPIHLDWQRADRHRVLQLNGVSEEHQILVDVRGVETVSARPDFLFWIKRPTVGDSVIPTDSLVVKPWGVAMWGADDAALDACDRDVRAALDLVGHHDEPRRTRRWYRLGSGRARKWMMSRPRLYQARALWEARS